MGIFQARILEWVAMPTTRGSSQARDQTQVKLGRCSLYPRVQLLTAVLRGADLLGQGLFQVPQKTQPVVKLVCEYSSRGWGW